MNRYKHIYTKRVLGVGITTSLVCQENVGAPLKTGPLSLVAWIGLTMERVDLCGDNTHKSTLIDIRLDCNPG